MFMKSNPIFYYEIIVRVSHVLHKEVYIAITFSSYNMN